MLERIALFLSLPAALVVAGLAPPAAVAPPSEPAAQIAPAPPVAAARPFTVRSPHGSRTDEYYWLRDDTRPPPALARTPKLVATS